MNPKAGYDMWPKSYGELVGFADSGTKNSIYVSEENKIKHIAYNVDKNFIYHIQIDGKVFSAKENNTKKMDFLLLNETKKNAYLIELKGCHLGDAIEQLEASYMALKNLLGEYTVNWRVVHKPRTHGAKTQNLQKKLNYCRKKYNLIHGHSPLEENI